jgi:hypothetical protein
LRDEKTDWQASSIEVRRTRLAEKLEKIIKSVESTHTCLVVVAAIWRA